MNEIFYYFICTAAVGWMVGCLARLIKDIIDDLKR